MVDAFDELGRRIDVKFIDKWYNIPNRKLLIILEQRKHLDGYRFYEWSSRPARPLELNDTVGINELGYITYDDLASAIRVSRGKWGGFYADIRSLLH